LRTLFFTLKPSITRLYLFKSDEGAVLLDTGIHLSAESIINFFNEAGVPFSDLKLIVVSHAHPDHYSGTSLIKKLSSAPVLSHKLALETLQTGKIHKIFPRIDCGKRFQESINPHHLPAHESFTPEILIDGEFDLRPYGIEGKLIPTPGHSACNLTLLLDSGEAFVNDMVTTSPYTKKNELALLVDDEKKLVESVRMLLSKAHTFYASHGGPYSKAEVIRLLEEVI